MMARRPLIAALLFCLAGLGCGASPSDTPDAGERLAGPDAGQQPLCDPTRCNPGHVCVRDQCMLACTRPLDCPMAYECTEIDGEQVCARAALEAEFGRGMYGYGCGISGDRDCAAEQGFICIGSVGDPDAYCARAECTADEQCPAGHHCGAVEREEGPVRACVRRGYCAPATSLRDCHEPDAVFAVDDDGNGFCSRSCDPKNPNGCGVGNGCFATESGGQCWPRQRTCVPQKDFCGRCETSLDCPTGALCFHNDFTKERFCVTACSKTEPCNRINPDGAEPVCATTNQYKDAPRCWPRPEEGQTFQCWLACPETGCQ